MSYDYLFTWTISGQTHIKWYEISGCMYVAKIIIDVILLDPKKGYISYYI